MDIQMLWRKFYETFKNTGLESGTFLAPGRVNLIGEHTDYNDGFVLPMAIEKEIIMLGQLRSDEKIKAYAWDYKQQLEFKLGELSFDKDNMWANYIMGIMDELMKMGKKIQGVNLMFTGNVPQGAGLSSSAALEVVAALMMSTLNQVDFEPIELALLAQRAENNFVGVQCGIMDQYISRLGKKNHALLIDCRTKKYELIPFENDNYKVVICNSKVKRGLVDSKYNKRREECNQAVAYFNNKIGKKISALRDVNQEMLAEYKDNLTENVYKRARHIITENDRVLESRKALISNNMDRLGELMLASHLSLRDDFAVSCAELDLLVELAMAEEGVKGARMTGAGFGGCTVNLVRQVDVDNFISQICENYQKKTGIKPDIYVSNPADGARKL